MNEDLPNKFDLVIIGTGFVESTIAAAASRVEKTVLHVDFNDFYGSCWASFNLENLITFLSSDPDENGIFSAKQKWGICIKTESEHNENDWTQTKLLSSSRKFNIDLAPKLIFSSGKLVDLLVSSNICRYAEFRAVDKIFTLYEGDLLSVPCSRTDIFNTKDLSIVEKRLLMKFLTNCINYEITAAASIECEGKTFLEYLQENKLSKKIIHCVLNSIAMCDANTPMAVGMDKMKIYLQSLGKYGNSPFLYPMYGCGEIPQCFCRLSAVFGGIYCLKKKVNLVPTEDENLTLEIDGNIINANYLVASNAWLNKNNLVTDVSTIQSRCGNLARGVLITSTPVGSAEQNSGGGGVNVIRLMDESDSDRAAIVLQCSHYSGTCPKGLYLIHITAESVSKDPEKDLEPFIKQICNESSHGISNVLYSTFFLIGQCNQCQTESKFSEPHPLTKKIYSTCAPAFGMDYDISIENAKNIFKSIYPEEPFLPRAPDPEEIVVGDEDPIALTAHSLPDDLKAQIDDIEQAIESMDCPVKEASEIV